MLHFLFFAAGIVGVDILWDVGQYRVDIMVVVGNRIIMIDVLSGGRDAPENTNIRDAAVAATMAGWTVTLIAMGFYGYDLPNGMSVHACMGISREERKRAFVRAAHVCLNLVLPCATDPIYVPWHYVPPVAVGTPVGTRVQFTVYRAFLQGSAATPFFPLLDTPPPIAPLDVAWHLGLTPGVVAAPACAAPPRGPTALHWQLAPRSCVPCACS